MEGAGCVLVQEAGEGGLRRGEPQPQSEEWWGAACLGSRNVQEAGDGLEFGPLCRANGTRDPGQSVSSWIH